MKPQFRRIDGLKIRYADSGGSQEQVIVLTSPWPESVYAFAPVWPKLADNARLFAIDLPGFGASESRDEVPRLERRRQHTIDPHRHNTQDRLTPRDQGIGPARPGLNRLGFSPRAARRTRTSSSQ